MNNWLHGVMYDPPWWAIALNAHFLPRRALVSAMRRFGPLLEGKVLDVGCGTQPYRALLTGSRDVVGLELDTEENRTSGKRADVYYDGRVMPFPDAFFQGVLCNQVLEHTFDPEQMLSEVGRVLEPGGALILTVPFVWPEHEQPHDSQRFTSFGLAHRLHNAGFEISSQAKLVPSMGAVCALAADRINSAISGWPLPFKLLLRALLIMPISMIGSLSLWRPATDPALYLDNFIVARKRPAAATDVG